LEEHPSIQCLRTGLPIRNFIMGIQFSDHVTWLSVNSQPLYQQDAALPYAVISSFSDITGQKQNEEKLSLAASVFTEAKESILITDASGQIVQVNKAFTDITGYNAEEVLGKNPKMLQSGYHDKAFYQAFWAQLLAHGHWSGEIWNRRKNGEIYAELETISAVKNEKNETHHYVSLASDISHQKQHEKQLEQQAYYDLLTGLPNRKRLTDELTLAIQRCQQTDNVIAVAYIDLDGFKQINDTYGHAVGDQLLMAVAAQMKKTLRETDTVGRIGGDEFVALLNVGKELSHSLHLVKRLLHTIAKTILIDDLPLKVSASIGLCFYPQAGEIHAGQLLSLADQAMYQAKQAGKNRYHIYTPE
jgi:PAS domain S-box/diguanylate cyclase (GGDEF) domain